MLARKPLDLEDVKILIRDRLSSINSQIQTCEEMVDLDRCILHGGHYIQDSYLKSCASPMNGGEQLQRDKMTEDLAMLRSMLESVLEKQRRIQTMVRLKLKDISDGNPDRFLEAITSEEEKSIQLNAILTQLERERCQSDLILTECKILYIEQVNKMKAVCIDRMQRIVDEQRKTTTADLAPNCSQARQAASTSKQQRWNGNAGAVLHLDEAGSDTGISSGTTGSDEVIETLV